MIIQTSIYYRNPNTEELLGKEIQQQDEFCVDLRDVSAITPYEGGENTCIFIHGRDVTITEPYKHIKYLWEKTKNLIIEQL